MPLPRILNRQNHSPLIDPTIFVASFDEARQHLKAGKTWPSFDSAISIDDPKSKEPHGFRFVPYRLRLEFDDIEELRPPYKTPTVKDIKDIIEFAERAKSRGDTRILIHCNEGKSRSVAAAFIFLCVWYGHGGEVVAMEKSLAASKGTDLLPNELMIEIADKLMNRSGKMIAALDKFFPPD